MMRVRDLSPATPPVSARDEQMLDAWAGGLTIAALMRQFRCSEHAVRQCVEHARDRGDTRAARRHEGSRPDVDPGILNRRVLDALAAELRPPGTPRRYLDIAQGRLIEAVAPPPRRRDITAMFCGDPKPGRSALDAINS
ncbi:MAG: hypothetical protein EA385_12870 [Salinarimonadaceae bacterium]|nr:MAG: hypothetical protein EA385_12870 [Salinarimonadaceae bacterium]